MLEETRIRAEFNKLNDEMKKRFCKEPEVDFFEMKKNRYKDVLPIEETRIKLGSLNCNRTGYINANFVSSPDGPKKYIACQAPLENTIHDFWQMVWENDVSIILMTTQLIENNSVKATIYWPNEGTEQFGDFLLKFDAKQQNETVILRYLTLKKKDNSTEKKIYHIQYLGWPDHGTPENLVDILSLINMIHNLQKRWNIFNNPFIVHCSAGIGRTGTFITILNCLISLKKSGRCIVPEILEKVRAERLKSVTNFEQYLYIYKTIRYFIQLKRQRFSQPPEPPSLG